MPGGDANAADQGITGRKLLLKSTPKFVVLSRDSNISGSSNPACPNADSSLTLDDGVNTHTFVLPCANWSNSGSVFKYKNPAAPGGPSEVKVAKLKGGLLKVAGKGLGISVPNGLATIDVVLEIAGTSDRYCMSFTGMGDGNRFVVNDAPAGNCHVCGDGNVDPGEQCDGGDAAACPGQCQADCTCPSYCSGQLVGGFCWFLGNHDQSCDDVCAGVDLTCSAATTTYAGSEGTLANCVAVMDAFFSYPPTVVGDVDLNGGFGCFV